MKVLSILLLVAVYGAVADDATTTVSVDATATTDAAASTDASATVSTDTSGLIGGVLDNVQDGIDAGLTIKENLVNSALNLGNTGAQAVLNIANTGIEGKASIANAAVTAGNSLGLGVISESKNVVDQITSIPTGIFGSYYPASAIQGVTGYGFGLAEKGVNAGTNIAKQGITLGSSIGTGITGRLSSAATTATTVLSGGEQLLNAGISNVASSAIKGASSGIKGIGNLWARWGNALASSAQMKGSTTATASTTTTTTA